MGLHTRLKIVPHPVILHKSDKSSLDDSSDISLPLPQSCHLCALKQRQVQTFAFRQPLLPVFDRHFVVGPRAGLWGAGTKQAGLPHSVPRSFFCPLCFSPPLLLPTRSGQYHPSLRLPRAPFKGSSHILCLATFQSITHTIAKVIFLFYIFNVILIISLQFNMHQCS